MSGSSSSRPGTGTPRDLLDVDDSSTATHLRRDLAKAPRPVGV